MEDLVFSFSPLFAKGDEIKFNAEVNEAGEYTLIFDYTAGQENSDGRSFTLSIGEKTERVYLTSMRDWNLRASYKHDVYLNEGANPISLKINEDDSGEINIYSVAVKKKKWIKAQNAVYLSGDGSDRIDFQAGDIYLKISSADKGVFKIWADKTGKFKRNYPSFAVTNEKPNPQSLKVVEEDGLYNITDGEVTIKIHKNPFKLEFVNCNGEVLYSTADGGIMISDGDEYKVKANLPRDEHFHGLGETPMSFDRRGIKVALWGNDIVTSPCDSGTVKNISDGRWYMNNPYFVSTKGYGILFDNTSRAVFDFGKDNPDEAYFGAFNPYPAGELVFYFIYGESAKGCSKKLMNLTGKSFFAPLWGIGNMQSHWGYTQADMERVAKTYREKNLPLDVIIADIEWYEYFCTPTMWNKENFPDPDGMMKLMKELNLHVGVIDDPNITDRDNNRDFADGDQKGYFAQDKFGKTKKVFWPWGWNSGLVDFFNPDAREWWKGLHKNLLDKGITFFWMDMNEPANYNSDWLFYNEFGGEKGTTAEMKNVYAMKHQQTMNEMMSEGNKRTMLLTRSGYLGTYRYACPWTGDIHSDYTAMKQQLNLGLGLSLSGYNYWTCDIGGSAGAHTDDMFKRWIELGAFLPVTRYHSTAKPESREPWTHGAEDIARKYISLRYALLPYMYSVSADCIVGTGNEGRLGDATGTPIVRPLIMEFPEDENTYGLDSQFMCGRSFLVAPVTDDETVKAIYLPRGKWYDYQDCGKIYESCGEWIEYPAPIDVLPILIKEGSVIPMRDVTNYTAEKPLENLILDIYPNTEKGKCSFVYYEDDTLTNAYKDGEFNVISITCETLEDNKYKITVGDRQGNFTGSQIKSVEIKIKGKSYFAEYEGNEISILAE